MEISELGEFGLIDDIASVLGEAPEGELWVGDDAAVIRAPAGTIFFTADMLVEGVHFDLQLTGPEDLGYKSLAVNISDIAAMGGTPWRAVVSLGLRPQMDSEWVRRLYQGMTECARQFSMAVVGGDISRSDCLVISVAAIGNPPGRRVVERRGAREGDAICVTGVLGASAAGYRLLRAGLRDRSDLIKAHLRPTPRVKEIEVLRRWLPSAMIDISDGLAPDVGHLCEASGMTGVIHADRIPTILLKEGELDKEPLELALYGGEDYELCFTMPQERVAEASQAVRSATGTPVTVIGEIVKGGPGVELMQDGRSVPLEGRGWDHLRR